jgi:hypothetical protein
VESPCFFCGYDRSGVALSEPCPECGKPFVDTRQLTDHHAAANRRARWIAAVVSMFVLLVWLGTCVLLVD